MPKVTFSQEDFLRSNQMKAGWVKLKVESMSEWKPSKSDPSANVCEAGFSVADGPFAGTPIPFWFSEKTAGIKTQVQYLRCFVDGELSAGQSYDLADTVGKYIMGYVEYDTEFRNNKIADFRKA